MKHRDNAPRQEIAVVNADPQVGLTEGEAALRRQGGWQNLPPESPGDSEKIILLRHLCTFFNLVFAVLAALLLLSGASVKHCAFLIVVVCNTVIGFVQELRAKRACDRLTLLARKPIRAVRDGTLREIPPEEAVRDDIVELTAGDPVCADGILRAGSLQVNESLITGEEAPVSRSEGDEIRSGSYIVAGRGRVQLTAVGADAYASKLTAEAKSRGRGTKSGTARSLNRLLRGMGIVLIPVGIGLFWQEYATLGLGLTKSMEGTVAALVGMIPEGLYLLTSAALAASALRLSRREVLVQDMNCIEALAAADVLCADKTGTITLREMEAETLLPLSDDPPEYLEAVLREMYSGREPENETDRAMAELYGGTPRWERTEFVSFSPEYKWSGSAFRERGFFLAGAADRILTDPDAPAVQKAEQAAAEGLRVLLVAEYRGIPEPGALNPELVRPLALALLSNRIRPEAEQTFRYFEQEGVSLRVISGDDARTVSRVAARAGIRGAERWIDASEDRDVAAAAEEYTVFGRADPEDKRNIVSALRKHGHTVAMTGDGINDIPAMKRADVSVAMASGAAAAGQVADLVLLRSDFAAMPYIVAEGRRVMNNIRRAATLFLVKNIFSLLLALVSFLTRQPYPFAPLHLTVTSALTIGIPGFFLAMEPNFSRVEGSFLPSVLRRALPGGLTDLLMVLLVQAFSVAFSIPAAETSAMCAAVVGTVGLTVLFHTCRPFNRFRGILWALMAVGLVLCFTAAAGLLELRLTGWGNILLLAVLLALTLVVYYALFRVIHRLWREE